MLSQLLSPETFKKVVFDQETTTLKNLQTNAIAVHRKLHQKVITALPQVLKPTLSILPFSWQKKAVLPLLNKVFIESLGEDEFECLEGKWLKLTIKDLNLHWLFSVENNLFIMENATQDSPADVCFSANGNDLLFIAARKEDPDTLFFQRRLLIEGDTALGLEIKNLIDALDTTQLPDLLNKSIETAARLITLKK